jgi:nucleotide-binding universal stress UspA family protein
VLTVGAHVAESNPNAASFTSILFATDFGPPSNRAFALALSLAEECGAKLVLLHMIPPMSFADVGYGGYGASSYRPEDLEAWHEEARETSLRQLKSLVPKDANLKAPPKYIVQTSFLPDGILDVAEIQSSDLIVMGASPAHLPRVAAHLPWTVVHSVLFGARCPVLTVVDGLQL